MIDHIQENKRDLEEERQELLRAIQASLTPELQAAIRLAAELQLQAARRFEITTTAVGSHNADAP